MLVISQCIKIIILKSCLETQTLIKGDTATGGAMVVEHVNSDSRGDFTRAEEASSSSLILYTEAHSLTVQLLTSAGGMMH